MGDTVDAWTPWTVHARPHRPRGVWTRGPDSPLRGIRPRPRSTLRGTAFEACPSSLTGQPHHEPPSASGATDGTICQVRESDILADGDPGGSRGLGAAPARARAGLREQVALHGRVRGRHGLARAGATNETRISDRMGPVHVAVEVGRALAADPVEAPEEEAPEVWRAVSLEGRRAVQGSRVRAPRRDGARDSMPDARRALDGREDEGGASSAPRGGATRRDGTLAPMARARSEDTRRGRHAAKGTATLNTSTDSPKPKEATPGRSRAPQRGPIGRRRE